jgi:hypothetical protein
MRLVVWNANMALHRKLSLLIDQLRPDVAVISECANDEVLTRRLHGQRALWTSMLWAGRNPNKGVGVFAFGDYHLSAWPVIDPLLEWVVPATVTGATNFSLLGIWAMNHRASNARTVPGSWPQPAVALQTYNLLGPTILAGDCNHNVVWDRPGTPAANHARNLQAAQEAGLVSAYHQWFGEEQGAELQPTFHRRGLAANLPAHHIDYVFIPEAWSSRLAGVTVGSAQEWVLAGHSDHVPLTVELTDGPRDDPGRFRPDVPSAEQVSG